MTPTTTQTDDVTKAEDTLIAALEQQLDIAARRAATAKLVERDARKALMAANRARDKRRGVTA